MDETKRIRTCSLEELPEHLQHIYEPPEALWVQGVLPTPGTKLLVVVGSRAISPYGREACESLIAGLAGYPISIVSGLALGADACAHRAALSVGLHTIAVPGSGLGYEALYPRAHVGLAHDILEAGGALLSEHPPDYRAHAYDFPSRNRIMVGLSDAVLIIEAGTRSGTLITARLAGEYGRTLLCVPHQITDAHGYGANLFLRIGATLVSEPNHILEALGLEERDPPTPFDVDRLSNDERILFALLEIPRTRHELLHLSPLPAHQTIMFLSVMELEGVLKEELGQWKRA